MDDGGAGAGRQGTEHRRSQSTRRLRPGKGRPTCRQRMASANRRRPRRNSCAEEGRYGGEGRYLLRIPGALRAHWPYRSLRGCPGGRRNISRAVRCDRPEHQRPGGRRAAAAGGRHRGPGGIAGSGSAGAEPRLLLALGTGPALGACQAGRQSGWPHRTAKRR